MPWIVLGLLTAFLTSLSDVFGRKALDKVDVYMAAWAWPFFCFMYLAPFLIFTGIPALGPMFWPAAFGTTVILTISSVFYAKAIKSSELSLTVPMLTFTPIFLLVTSRIMLGESPRPSGLLGIVLIVTGSYLLNFKDRRRGYLAPLFSLVKAPGPRYMFMVAVLYSVGANIDKVGVQNSSPLFWSACVNGMVAVPLFVLMRKKISGLRRQLKKGWSLVLLMGFCSALAMLVQMTAINMTIVPYLIAVKRMSVFVTALFGFWLFREQGIRERSFAAALMVLGVLVIAFDAD